MLLDALGYVEVGSADLEAWEAMGNKLLGMQTSERTATTLCLRMDDRRHRLLLNASRTQAPFTLGWEVSGPSALEALCARLDSFRCAVTSEPQAMAEQRGVQQLVSFADPVGNRLEVFFGPYDAKEPFHASRPISGFRTGPLGLGHAVLTVARLDEVKPFYENVLGFKLSDFTLAPFKAYFFHLNPRHHSLALIETGENGLHHLMVEVHALDDVGQAYDIALLDANQIGVSLGRHTNDLMTSFYTRTPSPFMIEYGWGGRSIDPATWIAKEYTTGPSLWGHERMWLPPEKRAEALALRLKAGTLGIREPVQVLPGNYEVTR